MNTRTCVCLTSIELSSVTRLGNFLMFLATSFLLKVAQIFSDVEANLETMIFK